MGQHLLLTLRLHPDAQGVSRYHGMAQGAPEWPPAPARVFQALVAGVARGRSLPSAVVPALEWLESLPPPVIAAPRSRLGQPVSLFVPNNDADSVPDPRDISGIRTKKGVHPRLIEDPSPLLYAWDLPAESVHAASIVDAAESVYQLGRGVDMAWAVGEVVDDDALAERLHTHGGTLHRPELNSTIGALPCPATGSLQSLLARHGAPKLRTEGSGRGAKILFTNAPKPRFVHVGYAAAGSQTLFELREQPSGELWSWPVNKVVALTERLRDAAADRLRRASPRQADAIDGAIVGRRPGAAGGPIGRRVRILPLPSIGHVHADRGVRRVLIETPSATPLRAADVEWAFAGLETASPTTGELASFVMIRAEETTMLAHYAGPSRRWRSVTPVVLPESAQRRRIEPSRMREEAKSAEERTAEQDRAARAVLVSLRQAGIPGTAVEVRVQREPLDAKGTRAEAFADGTRFAKERLWHVEVLFDRAVEGPLVIGDGRFLGLGLMAPFVEQGLATDDDGIFAMYLDGVPGADAAVTLARAMRRAVMARVQEQLGRRAMPRWFSGHEPTGEPAKDAHANHLAFQWDDAGKRLLVVAPHRLDRVDTQRADRDNLKLLGTALDGLVELRAGAAGRFKVLRGSVGDSRGLLGRSRLWESSTPYTVTRHRKGTSPDDVIRQDVLIECERRGLPRPRVEVVAVRATSDGLTGRLRLSFAVAVAGPIILGRSRYLGGGLFHGRE